MELIDNEYKLDLIEIQEDIQIKCAISKEPFMASITVRFKPIDKLFELVSFGKYLETLREETIESVCHKVREKTIEELNIKNCEVIVKGRSDIHPVSTVRKGEV